MPGELSIDPGHSAVLIMDYQTTIVAGYGTDQAALLRRAGDVLKRRTKRSSPSFTLLWASGWVTRK